MAKIKIDVQYDASEEIEKILSISKQFIEVDIEKDIAVKEIQKLFQTAFDEGRRFKLTQLNED